MIRCLFIAILVLFRLLVPAVVAGQAPDWYRAQDGTGIGNCGPACATMAVNWSKDRDLSVQEARELIGYEYEDGRTSLGDLLFIIKSYSAKCIMAMPTSVDEIRYLLDSRSIIIVNIDTKLISKRTTKDSSEYNRAHSFEGSHYIILSGTKGKWFIVQDPLNDGFNRLYDSNQVWKALLQRDIILILK